MPAITCRAPITEFASTLTSVIRGRTHFMRIRNFLFWPRFRGRFFLVTIFVVLFSKFSLFSYLHLLWTRTAHWLGYIEERKKNLKTFLKKNCKDVCIISLKNLSSILTPGSGPNHWKEADTDMGLEPWSIKNFFCLRQNVKSHENI
jgi:hypothetical protein